MTQASIRPESTSWTRWRDTAVKPVDYDDIPALVRLAREARGRIVEFEWTLSSDDANRFRRAVFEWGIEERGRYKVFNARILAAINKALGDAHSSILVLNEPGAIGEVDWVVSGDKERGRVRLKGQAPFDVVYGYGSAGVSEHPETRVRLGPTVQDILAGSVGMLGWDLRQLQEARFKAVNNALYGLPLNYGVVGAEPREGPVTNVEVHFRGPFSLLDRVERPCLFDADIAASTGLYLWTIQVEGEHRLWYVGQTIRGFAIRMGEHVTGFLSGGYTIYDSELLASGRYALAPGAERSPTIPSLLRNLETLLPSILSLIRIINVHVAPLTVDGHLYNRIEGALGRYYKSHPEFALRDFLTPGLRVPGSIPFDNPLRLLLSSDVPVSGLPSELSA